MRSDLIRKVRRVLPRFLSRRLPRKIKVIEISAGISRRLNRVYRGRNKPANVLSFYYGKDASRRSPLAKEDYGEVLVCPEVIRREAKEQGNAYQ